MRRAKIVCTIGPASQSPEVLENMMLEGMNVVRLNMSHGTIEEHGRIISLARNLSAKNNLPITILMDLSGPKIRLGNIPEPILLHRNDMVVLTSTQGAAIGPETNGDMVLPVNYPQLSAELKQGRRLSLADGSVPLEVEAVGKDWVRARVLSGGQVSSRKGVNIPGGGNSLPALTEKDEQHLRFGLEAGVDWVALSFVRSAKDVQRPRAIMNELGRRAPILAKIEKEQALSDIDGILNAFDGVMVARGDLGVELPLEQVPGIQKDLIRRANKLAKPAITATQMLLSMVSNPNPTRAEVADVANAIIDGSDAVMLSEETAMGADPAQTVATMRKIAEEADKLSECILNEQRKDPSDVPSAIAWATREVADRIGAKAIVTPTTSGSTARLVARTRPPVPILALSSVPATVGRLGLIWGVTPKLLGVISNADDFFDACRKEAKALGLAKDGDRIVVTAGIPLEEPGTTNLLRVITI